MITSPIFQLPSFRYDRAFLIEDVKRIINDGTLYRFKKSVVSCKDGEIRPVSVDAFWYRLNKIARWRDAKGRPTDCPRWLASEMRKRIYDYPLIPASFLRHDHLFTAWDMNHLPGGMAVNVTGIYSQKPEDNDPFGSLSFRMVEDASAWIKEFAFPVEKFGRKTFSYHLKHVAERWAGRYISNGAFIRAAMMAGYKVKLTLSPNCFFNMDFTEDIK